MLVAVAYNSHQQHVILIFLYTTSRASMSERAKLHARSSRASKHVCSKLRVEQRVLFARTSWAKVFARSCLLVPNSGFQLNCDCYDILLAWSAISEPSKFWSSPSSNFTSSYLHQYSSKWHDLIVVLIALTTLMQLYCHCYDVFFSWSAISELSKFQSSLTITKLHFIISLSILIQMT